MSISREDFEKASSIFQNCADSLIECTSWREVQVIDDFGSRYLRVSSLANTVSSETHDTQRQTEFEDELKEDDDEVLCNSAQGKKQPLIIYDVIHSPSYQVPVVYITFKDLATLDGRTMSSPTIDEVYDLLVPESYRSQIKAVGVMGALSMTDHPITGLPSYFVHPCQTPEAMDAVIGGKDVRPVDYLLLWLGLVGGSVGLEVPVPLAEAISKAV